jgi:drug/metabolite transporter (DMT)-like permease
MSSAGTGAAGTSVGLQIGLAALANVLTSSSMAVFNAWIFRAGYHFQFSLIVVQQIVCTLFALAQVTYLPGEKQKLRISGRRYFTMLLPFSAIVAAKLYIQNKAFEYVSPAFYAMIASTLPVGVTALAIVRKIEPFRLSTVVAAALVSVGGVMIKAGEVRLSGVGFVLTASALGLDVVRLVLMQYLVQPLQLSGMGVMLLSSPLQCLIAAFGAALFESSDVSGKIMAGDFPVTAWLLLLLNGALAMAVNFVLFTFMKLASAVVVAVTTPFKDLAIVAMSDAFVVKRTETPLSIAGFALACGTSLVYNVLNIRRREREKAQLEALDAPLIPPTSVGDGKTSSDLDAKEKEQDQKRVGEDDQASDDARTWRFDDAANAAMTCCALGMLLLATAVLARLDPADVARAYSLSAA